MTCPLQDTQRPSHARSRLSAAGRLDTGCAARGCVGGVASTATPPPDAVNRLIVRALGSHGPQRPPRWQHRVPQTEQRVCVAPRLGTHGLPGPHLPSQGGPGLHHAARLKRPSSAWARPSPAEPPLLGVIERNGLALGSTGPRCRLLVLGLADTAYPSCHPLFPRGLGEIRALGPSLTAERGRQAGPSSATSLTDAGPCSPTSRSGRSGRRGLPARPGPAGSPTQSAGVRTRSGPRGALPARVLRGRQKPPVHCSRGLSGSVTAHGSRVASW